jgi:glutamate-1-semialdehyde 2,1-aminomutase
MKNYNKLLQKYIPGGAHTYSRGADQFPSNAPQILVRGKGAYVWDDKGKKYLDYGMGLRGVTLGYANKRVNSAAYKEIERGNSLTRPSLTEFMAAKEIVNLIPAAEMVKFTKNGSSATTAAIKIARAYTGKEYVCVASQHPFFSYDDWFISSTVMNKGTVKSLKKFTLKFQYGDINSLSKLFKKYKNKIAAVILEPATTTIPCAGGDQCKNFLNIKTCAKCPNNKDNFLHKVQKKCKKEKSLFILDEMITGFRWDLRGAQSFFGINPDLSTFGKGMANGFSVAAVVGKKKFMSVGSINKKGKERSFILSTTNGAEMCGLGAFLETVKFYKQKKVINHLWNFGKKLKEKMRDIIKKHNLQNFFLLEGEDVYFNYITKNEKYENCLKMRTLFNQEMIKNGVLIPWISPSFSHGDKEISITIKAMHEALKIYKLALIRNKKKYIQGHVIRPVFRKYN